MLRNTKNNYGLIALLFHWTMAILVIGLLMLGLYMGSENPVIEKFTLITWHKELGIIVLGMITLRFLWRMYNITPALNGAAWEKLTARTTHWLLYALMFAMPLSGWLMSSAGQRPISFFGLFTLPHLIGANPELKGIFASTHSILAYSLMALVSLHIIAALKHHISTRNKLISLLRSHHA